MDSARGPSDAVDPESLLAEAGWVERLARRVVRDDASARDLVQETWLAALQSPPLADGRLRPWLARVLLNFARQRKRGDVRRVQREAAAARPERLPPSSEASDRIEAQRALADALAQLPEALKETVVLRYFDGLAPAEIAKRQGIPGGTVRWRLHRALDELRERLGRRSGGDGKHWAVVLLPLFRRPPLAEIAAHIAAGSAAAVGATVEGVMMMNTLTKVGIAAALVLTASVGVWVAVDRPAVPLDPATTQEPPPAPPVLDGKDVQEKDHALAAAPSVENRESAAQAPAKSAVPAASPAPEATTEARVEARFLDRHDRPVEGVKLLLRSFTSLPPAISAADGRAHLEVDLPKPTISTEFEASHAGLATHVGEANLDRGHTVYLGDVRLEPGGSVAGIVFGPDGRPARGVKVIATSPEMQRSVGEAQILGPWAAGEAPSGTTLADGTFQIDGVRVGSVRVWAGDDESRWSFSEPLEVPENSVRSGIELRLEKLQAEDLIAGFVLTPDGDPVPEADVRYLGRSADGSWSGHFSAGKDGHFRHRVNVHGTHELQAHDKEGRWPDATALDVQPGTLDLVLQFPKPRWIEIAVRARDGAPLPEFVANVLSEDKQRTLRAGKLEVHEKGRVSLLVPAEPFVIDVRARGHGNAVLGPYRPDAAPSSESCALDTLPGVRGQVRAAGEPVANARLALYEMADEHTRIERNGFVTRLHPDSDDTTTTDEKGFFQLDASRPGGADGQSFFHHDVKDRRTFAILCEADGWSLAEVSPLDIDPVVGVDGIQIALVKGGVIEGKVLTAPGKDPAGVVVGLDRCDAKPRTKRVGPDGRFRFEHLTPGRYRVARADSEFNPGNISTTWSTGDDVHADYKTNCSVDDDRTTHFDLDLRDDQPCVLVAQVSVNGAPATGWTASLWPKENATTRKIPGGAVDAQGRLRIEATEPGPGRLRLEPPADSNHGVLLEIEVDLHRGDNALPVDLKIGSVRGHCAAPPTESILDFSSEASNGFHFHVSAHIDANGRFEMPCVPAGPGRVGRNAVMPDGGSRGPVAQANVDVPMGGSVEVEVP